MKHIVKYSKWTLINEAEIFNKEKGGQFQALFNIGISIVDSLIKDHGFSPKVAAALAGNIFLESKFNPTILSSSGHYGLIQWGGDRKVKLKKLPGFNTIKTQLKFISQELNGLYSKILASAESAQSVEAATDIITRGYEGAAKSDIRRSAARELLAAYLKTTDSGVENDVAE